MKQIIAVQEEYFEFCLRLLQLIPAEEFCLEQLSQQAYKLRDQLKEEITAHFQNCKGASIHEIESEITRIKEALGKKKI